MRGTPGLLSWQCAVCVIDTSRSVLQAVCSTHTHLQELAGNECALMLRRLTNALAAVQVCLPPHRHGRARASHRVMGLCSGARFLFNAWGPCDKAQEGPLFPVLSHCLGGGRGEGKRAEGGMEKKGEGGGEAW